MTKAPHPLSSAATPGPVIKTPGPLETPAPALETPAPSLKTPAPVAAANRDPNSALPTIPPPKKEPSGAFPLPGMAPPEAGKGSDDVTLIARLSVLDELVEESTKVEPLEAALRAKASTENSEPIDLGLGLGEQAAAQRDKALQMAAPTALDRISAAEFEDPGDDDDELTVSATPGIISIEEDDEEPTASQRPPGAGRVTPAPVNLPGSTTPAPLAAGPRLPAPTPVPGRALHLPTPAGPPTLPPPSGLSGPTRAPTPAFSIPAPIGSPAATVTLPVRSAVFKSVQVPLGGIVACLVAVFGLGFVVGAYLWQTPAAPVEAHAPTDLPMRTVAAPEPAPAPEAKPAEPAPAPVAAAPAEAPPVAEKTAAPAPAPEPVAPKPVPVAAEKPETDTTKLVRHAAPVAKPRPVVRKPAPVVAEAPKPAPAKPAPAKPAPVAQKPAKAPEKAKGKGWVDPFAE